MTDAEVSTIILATIGLFGGIVSLVGTMFTAYMAYLMAKLNVKAKVAATQATNAAIKVEEVATTLKESTSATATAMNDLVVKADKNQKVTDQVHTLVNGDKTASLKRIAEALRRVATLTQDESEKEAANGAALAAEKEYADHVS